MFPFSKQNSAPLGGARISDNEKEAKVFMQLCASSSSASPQLKHRSSRRARSVAALALTLLAIALVAVAAWGSSARSSQLLSSFDEGVPPRFASLSSSSVSSSSSHLPPPRRRSLPSASAAVVAAAIASAGDEANAKSDAGFPLAVIRAPLLTPAELFTLQYYARGSSYVEWGSGASTVLVAPMARRAVSIENQVREKRGVGVMRKRSSTSGASERTRQFFFLNLDLFDPSSSLLSPSLSLPSLFSPPLRSSFICTLLSPGEYKFICFGSSLLPLSPKMYSTKQKQTEENSKLKTLPTLPSSPLFSFSSSSKKSWCDEMVASSDVDFWIKNNVLTYLCVDTGATGSFGTPTGESDPQLFVRYLDALDDAAAAVTLTTRASKRGSSSSSSSSTRLSLSGFSSAEEGGGTEKKEKQVEANKLPTSSSDAFTVVLVDGRFRVACALKAIWHLDHARGVLLVHD